MSVFCWTCSCSACTLARSSSVCATWSSASAKAWAAASACRRALRMSRTAFSAARWSSSAVCAAARPDGPTVGTTATARKVRRTATGNSTRRPRIAGAEATECCGFLTFTSSSRRDAPFRQPQRRSRASRTVADGDRYRSRRHAAPAPDRRPPGAGGPDHPVAAQLDGARGRAVDRPRRQRERQDDAHPDRRAVPPPLERHRRGARRDPRPLRRPRRATADRAGLGRARRAAPAAADRPRHRHDRDVRRARALVAPLHGRGPGRGAAGPGPAGGRRLRRRGRSVRSPPASSSGCSWPGRS